MPYEQQQFHALMTEHGVLDVTAESHTALAAAIRARLMTDS